MARRNYSSIIFEGISSVLLFALLGLILALIISFVQPLKYSSTVRLLVLQDVGASVDAYTASRSQERIAENLATIIFTTTFFDQVLNAGFSIDADYFPIADNKRRKAWQKTVDATVNRGSGLLSVSAYHPNIEQAEQISRAVAHVLTENVAEYTPGTNISVRLIDAPLNSRWPVKPNILTNAFAGFVLGGLVGVLYLLIRAERIRRRHQLIHEEY